jgi:hypothetical protein
MGEMLQQPEGKEVTVCLTACGRPDLLEQTLNSFFKFNTLFPKEFIVFEDSGTDCNNHLHEKLPDITWIGGKFRQGQIVSIDTMYQLVQTPYIFHCEEDWEFYRSGFIEDSLAVLEKEPMISMVWLREKEDTNQHPIIWQEEYGIMKTNHNGLWSGFCFNPGLRRLSDYKRFGAYGNHTQFNRKKPWLAEATISKLYSAAGYRAAILKQGYVKHLGDGRHVS